MDYDELFAYLFFLFGFVEVELFNSALTAIQFRAEPGTIPIRVSFEQRIIIVIAFAAEWGKSSQRSPPTAHETPGRLGLFDSSQLCYSTSLTNDETKPCRPVPNFVIGLSPT